MLSLYRSLMRPHGVVSTVAARSRRNLVLSSQRACEQALVSTQPAPAPPPSHIERRAIFSSGSMEELHALIRPSLGSMSPRRLMDCMLHSLNLAKRQPAGFSAEDDPSFQVLAGTVLTKIRFFNAEECVQLARFAGNLKLDCSASLVQGIYQMIRKQLNELDIEQMMTIRRSLRGLKGSSELTDALNLSLPLVFETQVERQLDTSNKDMCLKALRFVASAETRPETRNFVASAAMRFLREAPAQTAAEIMYGAAFQEQDLEHPGCPRMRAALQQCLGIVAANLREFDRKSVRRIMAAYSKLKTTRKDLHDALWALSPDLSVGEMMLLIKLSLAKRTMGVQDVDALGSFILAHREEFINLNEPLTCLDVVDCSHLMATQAVRLPGTVDRYKEVANLFADTARRHSVPGGALSEERPKLLVRFLQNIAILGVYPEQELDLVFSEESQEGLLNAQLPNLLRLIDLERLARLHFGESCKYVVKPELKKEAARRRVLFPIDEKLVESLHTVLGGEEFLLKNAVTPSGIEVDLVAVIDENERPVALNNKPSPLEDLPPNCKVIAFLECVMKRDIDTTTRKLKVPFALKERFLRIENIFPIAVLRSHWRNLSPNERIPFIRKLLKEEVACRVRTDRERGVGGSL